MKNKSVLMAFLFSILIIAVSCGEKSGVKKPGEMASQAEKSSGKSNNNTGSSMPSQPLPDGSLPLGLRLKPGQNYSLTITTNQKISQKIMNQQQTMNQMTSLDYSFAVENVDPNGKASVKVTYNAIRQEMEGPQGKIDYDSRKPVEKDNPLSRLFSNFPGKSFNVKIDQSGIVSDVSGMDKIIQSIVKSMEAPPGSNTQNLEKSISQQFGDDQVRETMNNMFSIYPDRPVKPGETWSKQVNLAHSAIPMVVENLWKLKEIKNGTAYVELNSKMKSVDAPASKSASPAAMKYKLNGAQTGIIEIDSATGWVKSSKISQKISGSISIDKNPQMPNGMTMPVSIDGSVVIQSKLK